MRLKGVLFLLGVFLLIVSVGNVSAQVCYIEDTASTCTSNSGYVVMKVSDTTNAHAELSGGSAYSNVLCCDFGGGDTTCDGFNKFLGISSSTNAHAESPQSSNYGTNVCYSGFEESLSSTNNPGGDYISILSLSSSTNAHAGDSNEYDRVVYAEPSFSAEDCDLTDASWNLEEISQGSNAGFTVEGIDICSEIEAELSIEVFRDDGQSCDIEGCVNPSNIFFTESGNATGEWTAGPAHPENYTFIATVVGDGVETQESANGLLVFSGEPDWCDDEDRKVNFCEDYETESECNSNQCNVAEDSVPDSIDCDDPDKNCRCEWDDSRNECDAAWDGIDSGGENSVGKCTYEQSTTNSCDDEPIGQLSFSWNATWEWQGGCEEGVPGYEDCREENEDLEAQCQDGSRTVECPAQIPLPFFNAYSFLITILLVVAVYMVLNMKKSKGKSGRKKKK
ncbi:MAG: hypothetical protein WDZ62_01480 [Candidatus Pacearchaeota archaeon]